MHKAIFVHIFVVLFWTICLTSTQQPTVEKKNDDNDTDADKPDLIPTKIPLPQLNRSLEVKYCTNTNETKNVIGTCTPKASVGGTQSPCPFHCMAHWEVKPGDPCDPFLYRFARREYDDATEMAKDWMGATPGTKGIIGRAFQESDADYHYKGYCRFLCPAVMCMEVHLDSRGEQFVDLVKWDCVSYDLLDSYKGVCTCGYLWSLVDPRNPERYLKEKTLLVEYNMTVGLNRRLAWDTANNRCAAQRYGHCSLGWTGDHKENFTHCLNPEEFKCVNRSANFLGVAYRPLKVEHADYWYGICDSQILIEDPFEGGGSKVQPSHWLLLTIIALPMLTSPLNLLPITQKLIGKKHECMLN